MNLFGLHELGKVYRREENRERKSRIRGDEKEILLDIQTIDRQ